MNTVVTMSLQKGRKLDIMYQYALAALESYRNPNRSLSIGGISSGLTDNESYPALADSSNVLQEGTDLLKAQSIYYSPTATYELKKLIEYFHTSRKLPAEEPFDRAVHTIFHSLYFPCIYVWDHVFGSDNIYVIEAERLSSSSSSNISEPGKYIEYTGVYAKKSINEELADMFRYVMSHVCIDSY